MQTPKQVLAHYSIFSRVWGPQERENADTVRDTDPELAKAIDALADAHVKVAELVAKRLRETRH